MSTARQTYLVSCREISRFSIRLRASDENAAIARAQELFGRSLGSFDLHESTSSDWEAEEVRA